MVARHALDEDGHLLVGGRETTHLAIPEGVLTHRGRVHRAHRALERREAFVRGALVGEEEAVVLAGEGVAEVVLEQRARPHDDRGLPEVLEHAQELLKDGRREVAAREQGVEVGAGREEGVRGALVEPVLPPAVRDRRCRRRPRRCGRSRAVRGAGEAVVGDVGEDRTGGQHADGLAAHVPGADEAGTPRRAGRPASGGDGRARPCVRRRGRGGRRPAGRGRDWASASPSRASKASSTRRSQ